LNRGNSERAQFNFGKFSANVSLPRQIVANVSFQNARQPPRLTRSAREIESAGSTKPSTKKFRNEIPNHLDNPKELSNPKRHSKRRWAPPIQKSAY